MTTPPDIPDAHLHHLQLATGLSPAQVRHVVAEVLEAFGETLEDFVTRRHRELKGEGLKNEAIYARLADEIAGRAFRAPPLSERQIRRLIYG